MVNLITEIHEFRNCIITDSINGLRRNYSTKFETGFHEIGRKRFA